MLTSSEVPIIIRRSASGKSVRYLKKCRGSSSPKNTMSGFTTPLQVGHLGTVPLITSGWWDMKKIQWLFFRFITSFIWLLITNPKYIQFTMVKRKKKCKEKTTQLWDIKCLSFILYEKVNPHIELPFNNFLLNDWPIKFFSTKINFIYLFYMELSKTPGTLISFIGDIFL